MSFFKADIDFAMENFVQEDRTAVYIPIFPNGSEDAFRKLSYYNQGDAFTAKIVRAVPYDDLLEILLEISESSQRPDILFYWKRAYGLSALFEHPEGTHWYLKIVKTRMKVAS